MSGYFYSTIIVHYNVLHVEWPIDDAQLGGAAGAALL